MSEFPLIEPPSCAECREIIEKYNIYITVLKPGTMFCETCYRKLTTPEPEEPSHE